jgi:DNA-binding NtrC family response regulator
MSQILIVDDQPYLHELVSQELMADGCVVKDFVHIDKLKEKIADILCRKLVIRA